MISTSSIPYFDLHRQYQKYRHEYESALLSVAASGKYILSQEVETFERAFADYCGSPHGFGLGSGTDALVLAFRALGIGKGDEVIVPSFTFSASVFSILHVGAQPVFVEVDEKTYNIDPKAAEKAITKRTRAILPVHLYGLAADMTPLLKLAKKHKLKIVEDSCQAHGATYHGKKTGSFGDAGCFSFYPTKNLGAFGDGGMLVTRHGSLTEKILRFRNLGRRDMKETHKEVGYTSRLDGLQAAILNIKLKYLDEFNEKRRQIAAIYQKELSHTPLMLPIEPQDRKHVYHLYVVRVPGGKRDKFKEHLQNAGIGSMIHYLLPVHKQPVMQRLSKKKIHLPVTDRLCKEILSLPMFPEMTHQEVERVCETVRSFYPPSQKTQK